MAEKILKSRIVHKHDSAENWSKATNFVPKQGEFIVYDKDSSYNYERLKIGDGVQNVNDLPFVDSCGIYVQDVEPDNAVTGDIWIDTANDPTYIPPSLPTITAADNGKVLMVVNGTLQLVNVNLSIDANGVVSM
jgi:hypothetical protein